MRANASVLVMACCLLTGGCGQDKASPSVSGAHHEVPSPSASHALLKPSKLPPGFPAKLVPVLDGPIAETKTGRNAGGLHGKRAWSVEIAVGGPIDKCFTEATTALAGTGLRRTRYFDQPYGKQAFYIGHRWDVVVTAIATSAATDGCTLTYAVGQDGLRVAG